MSSPLNMRRTAYTRAMRLASAAAALAALAAVPGSEAFAAPISSQGLQLATASGAFCKAGRPLSIIKRARTSAAVGGMTMELLGKRYWLWNVSEWALDKFIALTQVSATLCRGTAACHASVGFGDDGRESPRCRREG